MAYRGERSDLSERYAEIMKVLPPGRQDDITAAAIEIAVLAERERCAKIAEDYLSLSNIGINTYYGARSLPTVIRAEPKENNL